MDQKKIKVLYLEDEHYLGRIVKESLVSRGYDIKLIMDGANVLNNFKHFDPDICVLDIMVPNIDGLSLAKEIRKMNKDMPIIFLSAKNQTSDVLEGFKSGGNDYIKKPFSMEELIVRIENLIGLKSDKNLVISSEGIDLGNYKFYSDKFQLQYENDIISLSHKENELIKLFTKNINKKIDRSVILKNIWGDDSIYNSRNLDVYIRKIRIYFEKDRGVKIHTLRGIGYHFSVD